MGSERKRVYNLAKEYKISSNAMLTILKDLGFKPKSHMSVATGTMITAVKEKFAKDKQQVKKEMETKDSKKVSAPKGAPAKIGGIKVGDSKSSVAGLLRKLEKKQKKKDRRKKKTRSVDKVEVGKSFKSTMATLSTVKPKKKYRKGTGGEGEALVEDANILKVNEFMTLAEVANGMGVKPAEVISKLFEMGMMATINQRLDMDTIEMIADEYDFKIEKIVEIGETIREEEVEENLTHRAPVVTIMGHVDHGKTSLLDYIRESNVVAGESGAITQHIGAYEVRLPSGNITFLDTPGHEAFTAMRARGSQVTDIVVLIVAADGGVQPQTIEAIDHARAADAPIIVAINKIDKPTADPDNIRTQLSNHNVLSEEWGGKTIMVEISAKTGEGIDKLLEMILLQAEILDLEADSTIRGFGVVIDARLEKGRGPVATVLIQKGTAHISDSIVVGNYSGKIRTLMNDRDERIETVGPSVPAQITGLNGVPQAGDSFMIVKSDQEAKEIALKRNQIKREYDSRRVMGAVTLDQIYNRIKEGQIKELRLIIKADVDGSAGVLADTLGKIETDEVRANIIHKGVGSISESDILLASASDAILIGFHVSVDSRAREAAKIEKVDIRLYDIIYEAEKDVKDALSGLLAPRIDEEFVGMAEVRDVFKVPKIGAIAGCYVKEGRINRTDKAKLIRDQKIIYTGSISSLRRFKDDAREVKEGFECGIGLDKYNDIKVGDKIEVFVIVETARTL
ncbi:MAG: translation initiation factor IF-2 [Candidatus Zixiibacteriota bacterium]|nr:MAG: translation initiation factor IF-2 [candidate division Zixibacteria bacterium]